MVLSNTKITEIFYLVDEFCLEFEQTVKKHILGQSPKRKPRMSCSEVITIMILFHSGGFKNMKHFYLYYVQKHQSDLFPKTVSYNRFVELMQAATLPMSLFMKTCCLGEGTGISFIDSTPIRVCKNKRIKRNKVFEGLAQVGKSTMGYFFGFKLHIVINDKGELLNFVITPGNTDDREPLKNKSFIKALKGKIYADKGYISSQLTQVLFLDGLHLITSIRNNMKNVLMELKDKILLRKRSVIETVNDELKNICQIEHSRHRSFENFITNLIAGLIAYSFFPKKPAIKYQPLETNQLAVF
ncbi:IS982 family transposase [Algoriphagus sp.]|uniref:IS982 family transposase n=1 Tax=Algoriphagus sp. TaxID=1872435 RepID=UPI0026125A6B|nr:IS982 family transposase [Algoriphagus sp.]